MTFVFRVFSIMKKSSCLLSALIFMCLVWAGIGARARTSSGAIKAAAPGEDVEQLRKQALIAKPGNEFFDRVNDLMMVAVKLKIVELDEMTYLSRETFFKRINIKNLYIKGHVLQNNLSKYSKERSEKGASSHPHLKIMLDLRYMIGARLVALEHILQLSNEEDGLYISSKTPEDGLRGFKKLYSKKFSGINASDLIKGVKRRLHGISPKISNGNEALSATLELFRLLGQEKDTDLEEFKKALYDAGLQLTRLISAFEVVGQRFLLPKPNLYEKMMKNAVIDVYEFVKLIPRAIDALSDIEEDKNKIKCFFFKNELIFDVEERDKAENEQKLKKLIKHVKKEADLMKQHIDKMDNPENDIVKKKSEETYNSFLNVQAVR
eukprot:GHVL01014406.1.p1 GENE.GHVL01014406.1~~GHVL01014406.1.p1  ORF type:complete len:379 (-),score=67.03 GHVL01014406.1:323-1459(-)